LIRHGGRLLGHLADFARVTDKPARIIGNLEWRFFFKLPGFVVYHALADQRSARTLF
jgi:hypothetical protein